MVEVFKTNVNHVAQANYIIALVFKQFPDYVANFDLNDCDKILRVEGVKIDVKSIIVLLNQNSLTCEELPD